jgi:hypothetical protein
MTHRTSRDERARRFRLPDNRFVAAPLREALKRPLHERPSLVSGQLPIDDLAVTRQCNAALTRAVRLVTIRRWQFDRAVRQLQALKEGIAHD